MAATASIEASQSLIQNESHVTRTYTETTQVSEPRLKKKKSSRRHHKDEGTISVSKSSELLHKKMKAEANGEANPQCQKCSRPVYAMERIKAEKRIWHKECFRCVQCNKALTVETYQSDHTTLYCKHHFKQLFEPKPVGEEDEVDATPKKHQMIICESNPVELPPDVVRASDKPDLGLDELSQLDVKSRFEVFEKKGKGNEEPLPMEPKAPREKSTALLSKLAKFKAKGMDIGVSDEYLNGVPIEASSSEPEEDEDDEDSVLKKSYKHTSNKEQPVSFCNMSEIVGRFEAGQQDSAERHRSRKQEIQNIRSRLFMGKQAKIKEMYEQSVMQSEQSITSADKIARELDLDAEKARFIKQRFETGEVYNDENQPPKTKEIDDRSLFNEDTRKPRNIKQLFETGEAFKDEKRSKYQQPDDLSVTNEGPTPPKSRHIKDLFETGDVYKDGRKHKNHKHDDRSIVSEGNTYKVEENGINKNNRDDVEMIAKAEIEDAPKSRSIKDLFESGDVYKSGKRSNYQEREDSRNITEGKITLNTQSIKNVFETGAVYKDAKHQHNEYNDTENISSKGNISLNTRSIKDVFETGSVYKEDKHLHIDPEIIPNKGKIPQKTQSIKDIFESGVVYKEKKHQTNDMEVIPNKGKNEDNTQSIITVFQSGTVYKEEKPRDNGPKIISNEDTEDSVTLKSRSIKELFESGEVYEAHKKLRYKDYDDRSMINEGIGKKSRSIFLELDANAKNLPPTSPPPQEPPKRKEIPFIPKDVVRAEDKLEDVQIQTSDISDRFKFFETYKPESARKEFRMTPPRQTQRPKSPSPEVYHDPTVVRSEENVADTNLAAQRHTASRMISVFRQMEENLTKEDDAQGPRPLKEFTPPPPGAYTRDSSSEGESESEYEEDSEEERRRLYLEARERDEALKQAQQLARTKSFRDRFENWSESEPQRSPSNVLIERQPTEDDDGESQLETAKSLRAKFESMKVQQSSVTKTFAPKVNRFV